MKVMRAVNFLHNKKEEEEEEEMREGERRSSIRL
jgi:hypothetical protein